MSRTLTARTNELGDVLLTSPEHHGSRMHLDRRHIDRDRADGVRWYECLTCGVRQEWEVPKPPRTNTRITPANGGGQSKEY